jgi:hypothetical protein
MYEHGEQCWNDIDREKNHNFSTRALWQSYQKLSSSETGGTGEGNDDFVVRSITLTCRNILRHEADGFTFSLKEGALRI